MIKEVKKPKPLNRKCKVCKSKFKTFDFNRWWCCPDCGVKYAQEQLKKQREKDIAKRNREEKLKIKATKERLKSRAKWLSEAQKVFNKFIRLRDKDEPCISCGRYHQGKYDAGHYRSVGACPELRFCELNVHKQCVPCNQHKSGNVIEYRINLIKRIGTEKVAWLERQDHDPRKYTIEECKEIIKTYKAKIKGIENAV